MSKTMLVNTVVGHECRIAILDNGRLEELYTERVSSASQVGSIFKGRITNIEPSIQAAFVDFGGSKNGFLHISDVHPQYFPKGKETEAVGRRTAHRTRPPIQHCLKRGQEIVVQMTKQGIGTKGPTLTTYLSIPGRLLVMMPGMTQVGVSRKIEDEDVRQKLRKSLEQLDLPKDMGVIIRTAGIDRSKRDLQRDLSYLTRLWNTVTDKVESVKAPAEIYQESDLVTRTLRDVFDSNIDRIVCDSQDVARTVKQFLDLAGPRAKCRVEFYRGRHGLFDQFNVEEEITRIHSHRVEMKNGGSLVIDQTEALVAIDVNSGSFRAHSNAEQNALNLNLAAAEEIGRQLRLRDLGGVIVMDFVDMRDEKNRRALERKIRDVLKKDRAKSKVTRISAFGLVEMTRQRLRPSLKQSIYARCPHCAGTGQIMSPESMALAVMRDLKVACSEESVAKVEVVVSPDIAMHLANSQRQSIADIERETGKRIVIAADESLTGNDEQIHCTNGRGAPVSWDRVRGKGAKDSKSEFVEVADLPDLPEEPDLEDETSEDAAESASEGEESKKKRRRRRGGRRRKKSSKTAEAAEPQESEAETTEESASAEEEPAGEDAFAESTEETPKKKRRRGRRGGRRRKKTSDKAGEEAATESSAEPVAQEDSASTETPAVEASAAEPEAPAEPVAETSAEEPAEKPKPKAAKRTRRKKAAKKKTAKKPDVAESPAPAEEPTSPSESPAAEAPAEESVETPVEKPKRKAAKRPRRKKAVKAAKAETPAEPTGEGKSSTEAPAPTEPAAAPAEDAAESPKPKPKAKKAKAKKKRTRKASSASSPVRDPDEIPDDEEW